MDGSLRFTKKHFQISVMARSFLRAISFAPRYNTRTWGWVAHLSKVARDQLHGWKEIAAYLGRDERTAKRWEKQRGLPVRRIPGSGRANVYILIPELEAWLSADSTVPSMAALNISAEQPGDEEQRVAQGASFEGQDVWRASALQHLPVHVVAASSSGLSRSAKAITLMLMLAGGVVGAAFVARRPADKKKVLATAPALKHAPDGPPKPEVDQQYLQSLYFLEQRTPASLEEAKRNLLEVIAHNPRHAPAFAQLANTYLMLHEFASVPDEEAYTQAQRAASQAIALDPSLPEAHASLGYIDFFSARNPGFAESHFQEAIRLDPACALAHFWYGSLLTHQGRFPEALVQLNRAQQLQPTSSAIQSSRAFALGLSGQRDEAIRLLRALLKTDPNAPAPHRTLARLSLMQPRDVEQYLDEMQKFAELRQSAEQQQLIALARQSFDRGGEQAMWRSVLASERAARRHADGPSYVMAQAEAQLGQIEPSLRDLERLCAKHDSQVMNLAIDPLFEPVRHDPRFGEMVALVGLRAAAGPPDSPPAS